MQLLAQQHFRLDDDDDDDDVDVDDEDSELLFKFIWFALLSLLDDDDDVFRLDGGTKLKQRLNEVLNFFLNIFFLLK